MSVEGALRSISLQSGNVMMLGLSSGVGGLVSVMSSSLQPVLLKPFVALSVVLRQGAVLVGGVAIWMSINCTILSPGSIKNGLWELL